MRADSSATARETEMADQSERGRRDGVRLMRAFFRIEDSERRRAIIDLAERMARDLPAKSVQLHVVKNWSPGTKALTARSSRRKPDTPR
jgi:hypothetical protein